MLGRPVRPSVWEITGNVGLRARMRNGGWWRWKLKSENWKLRDVLAWETENQRRFVLPRRRKVTNVSKVHYQRKKKWFKVHSSIMQSATIGLQKLVFSWREEGKRGPTCDLQRLQGAEGHLLCLSIFEKEALYSIYIVGILCTSLDSYLFLWKLLKLAVVTSFWPFPFLPISMSECYRSLECAQNLDRKNSISFL